MQNGSKAYWVEYHTTTPGDGRKVQNVIQLTTADGTPLTYRSNRPQSEFKAERVSLVKGQIEASTAFKIKINKTNAFTLVPVAGAVYTVRSEDGTISTELTTNEKVWQSLMSLIKNMSVRHSSSKRKQLLLDILLMKKNTR